jgi:hypothetical protein
VEVILVIFLTIFIVRYYFSMGIVAKHPTTTTTTIVYSKSSPSINNATVKLLSPNLQEKEAARSVQLQSPDHSSSSAPSVNSTIETISQPDDEDVFSKPIIEPVWGSLVRILKRRETLQAAQEASKAGILGWKELMKEIDSDEAALHRTSNHTLPQGWKKVGVESRQCPNSSTFSDFSSASSGLSSTQQQQQQQGSSWRSSSPHHELPIPCGLVVDSSITIVATPGGQRSGDLFEIALLGPSQLKGEADDAPIFLNYSVQFTGDNNNSTNPPVIVQSTWTSEKQWQHEEHCPSSSYSSPAIDKHPGRGASLQKYKTLKRKLIRLFL